MAAKTSRKTPSANHGPDTSVLERRKQRKLVMQKCSRCGPQFLSLQPLESVRSAETAAMVSRHWNEVEVLNLRTRLLR